VAALDGQTAFTITGRTGDCVLAVNTTTGRPLWNWSARTPPAHTPPAHTHPAVMAVTAGYGIVMVATGHDHDTAPAAVYPLIDHLTALSAATGRQLWTLALTGHGDGQWIPAAISNDTVIVTEADGAVEALDAQTGALRWKDSLPPTCHPNTTDLASTPAASIFTAAPIIGYQCAHASELTALNPATGAPRWTWQAPSGWTFNLPPETASTAGITAVIASGPGQTTAPARRTWTLGPRGYDPVQIVAIDDTTGRPVWVLDDVAASADVYASDGQTCAASPYGVECLNTATGAEAWQWRAAVAPSQEPGLPTNTAAAANGRLYDIAATPAAARVNPESTTQRSAPGTFILQVRDIATGHVITTRPLPAYYGGGSSVVVSVDDPPGVAAADGPMVLVTPEFGEPGAVEGFDMMTG
jgi:outer membrane protein assembly factor BamB